jgi:carboxyl-terminal processing protease
MKRTPSRVAGLLAIALLTVLVTHGWARSSNWASNVGLPVDVRYELLNQYVEELDPDELAEAAVRGMIESLDDPYTTYLDADDLAQLEKQVSGSFSGIGAEITTQPGRLTIVTPLEDSPAWNAGVMAGDTVLEIDGQTTENITVQEAVARLTGQAGTDVTIKVRHETGEEKVITITRAQIQVRSVRGFNRNDDNSFNFMLDEANRVGYVRLTSFSGKTVEELTEVIRELNAQGMRGLILDVRFDPGGLLSAAVGISDMFLDEGQRIVSVKGRRTQEQAYDATADTLVDPGVEVVILANEASASASEILTGALSDNGRALFVGTRTFGKGSVQNVKMLDDAQGALKFTNAYYYLPNGRNIHRRPDKDTWGVDPSPGSYVKMSPEAIREMMEVRRAGDVIKDRQASTEAVTPDWLESDRKDPQLAAALRAVLGKLASGTWPTVGEDGADELANASRLATLKSRRDALNEALAELDKRIHELSAGPVLDADLDPADGTLRIEGDVLADDDTDTDTDTDTEPEPEPRSDADVDEPVIEGLAPADTTGGRVTPFDGAGE